MRGKNLTEISFVWKKIIAGEKKRSRTRLFLLYSKNLFTPWGSVGITLFPEINYIKVTFYLSMRIPPCLPKILEVKVSVWHFWLPLVLHSYFNQINPVYWFSLCFYKGVYLDLRTGKSCTLKHNKNSNLNRIHAWALRSFPLLSTMNFSPKWLLTFLGEHLATSLFYCLHSYHTPRLYSLNQSGSVKLILPYKGLF